MKKRYGQAALFFLRILILASLLFVTFRSFTDAYDIYLGEVVMEKAVSDDRVNLIAHGGNMLRVNSFYLDGKRVGDALVEKITYDRCSVTLDRAYLEPGKWHRMEVGFSCLGVIHMRSTPIWLEWPY